MKPIATKSAAWQMAKYALMRTWFRPGTYRQSLVGPYAGITFEICPQLTKDRMCVFYTGYEPEVANLLAASFITTGSTVYVVGAHVGIHALFAAKLLNGSGIVYAFEPWPENYAVLAHNVAANPHLSPVVPVAQAVSDHDGVIGVVAGTTDGTHHVAHGSVVPSVTVPVTTLDTFCGQNNNVPSLLLVDVEGEEIRLLSGARALIEKHHPKIVMECHSPELRRQAIQMLGDWRYKVDLLPRHVAAY